MQKELLHNEAWLKSIFNGISDGLIIADCDYNIYYSNTAAEIITGWTSAETAGKNISEIYDLRNAANQPYIQNLLLEVAEGAQEITDLSILRTKGGENKNIRHQLTALRNGLEVVAFSLVFKEIHASDASLRDNTSGERRFKSIAENSPDIIYIIDLHQREVIYFNRENIFGNSSKELQTPEGWIGIVHPDDRLSVEIHWAHFLNTSSGTESIEYRLKRKDGEYEWVINRHTIIERDFQKQPLYVLLNITIITERKKTEGALRESEARLTALIENTNDIIWSVDKHCVFTAMNSSFKNLFKFNFKRTIKEGAQLFDSLPAKINTEWLQYHKRALNGERFSTEFNLTGKSINSSYEISYNPIFSDEGSISGVSVFGRDITSRKLAENDIIRTNFELDSFVYRASHDLRAPLRSVLGLINIVKTEENAKQRNLYLNLVDKSVYKLDTFIADLTNFSRNSRLDIQIEKINFSHIISECIENLKYMENASIIDIKTELIEKFEFYSDPGRISIILQNLLSNSIKYRNHNVDKSHVLIKVAIHRNNCEIIFEDNGKGIKEEYLDKIFNMFFRASHDSYGSGLGLYITKQVVEKLNGNIHVNSTLGTGSTFEIKLPNLHKNL